MLHIRSNAQPDNDFFARRIPVAGSDVRVTGYSLDATLEPGEPQLFTQFSEMADSIWWTWAAPADGFLSCRPRGSSPGAIAVYAGDVLESLTPVGQSLFGQVPFFPVVRGTAYSLAAYTFLSQPNETVWDLDVIFRTRPSNDSFARRLRLTGDAVNLLGHNAGVTEAPGDPTVPGGGGTVWWEWIPTRSGVVTEVWDAPYNGRLYPYRGGDPRQLEPIPNEAGPEFWKVTAGEPVQLAVSSGDEFSRGDIAIRLRVSPISIVDPSEGDAILDRSRLTLRLDGLPESVTSITVQTGSSLDLTLEGHPSEVVLTNLPVGHLNLAVVATTQDGLRLRSQTVGVVVRGGQDAFTSAPEISSEDSELGGWFPGTSLESGELPLPSRADSGTGTVWWRWTPSTDGWLILESGNPGRLNFQVFRGEQLASLVEVSPRETPSDENLHWFPVEAGKAYRLRLWRTEGFADWDRVWCRFMSAVANDAPSHAENLLGERLKIRVPRGITRCDPEEPDPCPENSGSRWYAWTAPADGRLWIRLDPPWPLDPSDTLSLFTGSAAAELTLLVDDQNSVHSVVHQGVTYWLRLRSNNDPRHPVPEGFFFSFSAFPPNDEFVNREFLTGAEGQRIASNEEATSRQGEYPSARSVWWSWTAPGHGVLEVEVIPIPDNGTLTGLEAGLWSGDSFETLQQIHNTTTYERLTALAVESGESVEISVMNRSSPDPNSPSVFQLRHRFLPAPANDSLTGRIVLSGSQLVARGTNWNALTMDSTDPVVDGSRGLRSIWWEWVAPQNGWLAVEAGDRRVTVFNDESAGLTPVSQVPALTLNAYAPVNRGVHYLIQVADVEQTFPRLHLPFGEEEGFLLSLRLQQFALDFPTNRLRLPAGEPVTLRIASHGEGSDDDITSLSYVARNQWFPSHFETLTTSSTGPAFSQEVSLVPGFYWVQAVATNALGEILWTPPVELQLVPHNDLFLQAETVSGRTWSLQPYFNGATKEFGEPLPNRGKGGTTWYRWKAPSAGIATVEVHDGLLNVYAGSRLGDLQAVPNQPGVGFTFAAARDTDYFLRVSEPEPTDHPPSAGKLNLTLATTVLSSPDAGRRYSWGEPVVFSVTTTEAPGDLASVEYRLNGREAWVVTSPPFEFSWGSIQPGSHAVESFPRLKSGEMLAPSVRWFTVGPVNDRRENGTPIQGVPDFLEGTVAGSSIESGGGGDVWFSWRAPADGMVAIRPEGVLEVELLAGPDLESWELQATRQPDSSPYRAWLVRSEQSYFIRVRSSDAELIREPFRLPFEFYPPATNDDFVRRISLSGEQGETTAFFANSTLQPGEPVRPSGIDHSIWWTWTPAADGFVQFGFPELHYHDDGIIPYEGNSLGDLTPLTPIARQSQGFPNWYPVQAGVPVQIALVNPRDGVFGLRWQWRLLRLPLNDAFAHRIPVSGTRLNLVGSSLQATLEPEEPLTGDTPRGTVWWSWTPGQDGEAQFKFLAPWEWDSRHVVSVFTGESLDSLIPVPVNEGSPQRFEVRAGVTYQLRLMWEAWVTYGAPFSVEFQVITPPANDAFSDHQLLQGSHLQVTGSNYRSSREFHEPYHAEAWGGRSVWYRWRAPGNGPVRVRLESGMGLHMAVYEGEALESLQAVAASRPHTRADFIFWAEAGRDYALAVDGALGIAGDFLFYLDLEVPPTPVLKLTLESETLLRVALSGLGTERWILESGNLIDAWSPIEELSSVTGTEERILEWDSDLAPRFFRVRRRLP